jgi:DNA-binding response OmpR family regulator
VNRPIQHRPQPTTQGESAADNVAPAPESPAQVLIVGGEPDSRTALVTLLRRRRHQCTHVERLDEAQTAIAAAHYDLILLDPALPDGDGLELASLVQRMSPATKTMVFSATGSFKAALDAMRCGVVDFVNTPLDLDELVDRVEAALRQSRAEYARERRISKLQRICKELNVAREEIAEQVDLLCNDLVAAYDELTEQLNQVALATEFRTLIRQELDVEETLRTALEYLLAKTGPTNAAVFLPDGDGQYSLGAYVNYDCPRASIDTLLDHLCQSICPQMAKEEDIVAFDDAAEFAEWIGLDDGFLDDSQIIAYACAHEGEPMAVVILFRSANDPFDGSLASTLDTIRGIFAEQLARLIRIHHRAKPQWPEEAADDEFDFDDEFGFGDLAA